MLKEINNLDVFKKIAANNLKSKIETLDDFYSYIERWYRKKYNLTDNDPRFLSQYIETMMIEFFEDWFENNPKELEAYEKGFDSAKAMSDAEDKKIMGDEYTEDISYLVDPNEKEEIIEQF